MKRDTGISHINKAHRANADTKLAKECKHAKPELKNYE